jgi:cytochrome c1
VGDPAHGKVVMLRQACGSCHQIPGFLWADGVAGPPLAGIARRAVIAGVLPNTSDNMVRWLRFPQAVAPGNAMPDMGLSEADARDVAAYLEGLR